MSDPLLARKLVERAVERIPLPGDTQEIDITSFGATEKTILVQRYMEDGWVTVATRKEPFGDVVS